MQERCDQLQIIGQAVAGMLAVDMGEAYRAPAELLTQSVRRDRTAVRPPGHIATASDAVGGAIGVEPPLDARIGPVEAVDAQGCLSRGQAKCHCDEKAAFERADFDQIAANATLGLQPDQMPADRRGKAGGHAAHLLVTLCKIEIDGRMAARDIKHRTALAFCRMKYRAYRRRLARPTQISGAQASRLAFHPAGRARW